MPSDERGPQGWRPFDQRTVEAVSQYHELVRIWNQDCQPFLDVVVHQYVPQADEVQHRDWLVLADADPLLTSARLLSYESGGVQNQYVEWRFRRIPAGALVQVGVAAKLRHETRADGTFRAADTTPPARPGPFVSLADLCQLDPEPSGTLFAPEGGLEGYGLEPASWSGTSDGERALWEWCCRTAGDIDWEGLHDSLTRLRGEGFASSSRAGRFALFLGEVLGTQTYGDGPEADADVDPDGEVATGLRNVDAPGTPLYPAFVAQGLILVKLAMLEPTFTAPNVLTNPDIAAAAAAAFARVGIAPSQLRTPAAALVNDLIGLGIDQDLVGRALTEIDEFRRCRCSERTLQAIFLFRCAGLAAREVAGQPLSPGYASATTLARGALVGHRWIEVWADELSAWFPVDSTSTALGPAMSRLLVTFRGATGPRAPLGWSFSAEVVQARRPDGTEASLPIGPSVAPGVGSGSLTRQRLSAMTEAAEELASLRRRAVRYAVRDRALPFDEPQSLTSFVRTELRDRGVLDLSRLPFAGVPPAPSAATPGGALDLSRPNPAAYAGLVLLLAPPDATTDPDHYFARRYLARPAPCGDGLPAGSLERILDTTCGRCTGLLTARSPWLWVRLVDEHRAGVVRSSPFALTSLELAVAFGPPAPDPQLVGAFFLGAVGQWLVAVLRLSVRIAAYAAEPDTLLPEFGAGSKLPRYLGINSAGDVVLRENSVIKSGLDCGDQDEFVTGT